MNLHYSQTDKVQRLELSGLTIIWIYTTLKPEAYLIVTGLCLTIIWIYTTLKREVIKFKYGGSLTIIWIYTTLKPKMYNVILALSFDYHMNLHYSQTKPQDDVPFEEFDYHMNLHYSQTSTC